MTPLRFSIKDILFIHIYKHVIYIYYPSYAQILVKMHFSQSELAADYVPGRCRDLAGVHFRFVVRSDEF